MNYKLLAVDMDGTLLDSSGNITPRTSNAVKQLISKGSIFTISTGRPIQGVEKYSQILPLTAPIITYNGAMIITPNSREILFERHLNREDAKLILSLGRKFNTTMCIWSRNQLYGNILNDKIYDYQKLSGVSPLLMDNEERLLDQGITKILWYDTEMNLQQWQNELKNIPFQSVTFCTSKPVFLEFYNKEVSKAFALQKIGELYGISHEEMIAVGDGMNDLPMIQYAGLGVSMENGDQELKKHSQYITSSNNSDGIAEVIEKFF